MAYIMTKDTEQKIWKEQMKTFASYSMRNEDILYNHNVQNKYMVMNNKEFLEQLKYFNEKNLILYEHNIKKFTYKKKDYYLITINGDNIEGTSCERINRQAFALNFMVSGYSYLFKYHSYKEIEKEIKSSIKYIKKLNGDKK
jgi:hypothetical protein